MMGEIPTEEGSALALALQVQVGCTPRDHICGIVQHYEDGRARNVRATDRPKRYGYRQASGSF